MFVHISYGISVLEYELRSEFITYFYYLGVSFILFFGFKNFFYITKEAIFYSISHMNNILKFLERHYQVILKARRSVNFGSTEAVILFV